MSYEGREIYICPKGHLSEIDCYDDYDFDEAQKKNHVCVFCGKPVEHIGGVDDTNGEAVARFYKKVIRKSEFTNNYDPETDTVTICHKPEICEIVRGGENEWFNFDTGEKHPIQ